MLSSQSAIETCHANDINKFFSMYYKRIVNYCSRFDFNFWDVEEAAVDAILKNYIKHKSEGLKDPVIYRYMSRRVMLDLKTKYTYSYYRNTTGLSFFDSVLDHSDPQEIVSLFQRLPNIDPILISYQQFEEGKRNLKSNTAKFNKKRNDFLYQLDGNVIQDHPRFGVKKQNKKLILDFLKIAPKTSKDISDQFGLPKHTIVDILRELKDDKLIIVSGKKPGNLDKLGRKTFLPAYLRII